MILFTIGHGTRPFDEFVEFVRAHGIARVVDVRSYPGSRKNPQYGKERLERTLPAAGIEYEHMLELGGRRRGLGASSPNTGWEHEAFRGYADYMMEPAFWSALDELLRKAAAEPVAVMCSETLWWKCHRRMIADAATARGAHVRHIMRTDLAAPHQLTPFAKIVGGRVAFS